MFSKTKRKALYYVYDICGTKSRKMVGRVERNLAEIKNEKLYICYNKW